MKCPVNVEYWNQKNKTSSLYNVPESKLQLIIHGFHKCNILSKPHPKPQVTQPWRILSICTHPHTFGCVYCPLLQKQGKVKGHPQTNTNIKQLVNSQSVFLSLELLTSASSHSSIFQRRSHTFITDEPR